MESSEQALAIWSVLSDVYDKSPWSLSQISEDLKKDSTDYFF
ncbi:ribosomal-protein-alanine N-acetyltransferase, partial [Streptococcus agalactiae]|nr:ribosomal-protein-alanine N-acetyltransferase [Streptococcus agalactiae]MCC9859987.1 ribosomal-protein-alanine N-acetyltransferase [Streptococcus agalactiae]MCD0007769.1 ribosomal-protein-alanine N-acetyltransferase [Streptococcus agalactiae]MCK6356502.1 ribosomal-protein-alanine N-acetyltransferase [Streptococcus agalactiae]